MNIQEAKKLKAGDQVFWNDPDEGICSKLINIAEISIKGNIVMITGDDGADLGCFARELEGIGQHQAL